MSWLLVVPLALAAFALAAFAFRLDRGLWTALLAALVFGLAGYALQANPRLPAAPHAPSADDRQNEWGSVEARKEMVAERDRSGSDLVLIADAMVRQGQFANAAAVLRGAVDRDPRDGEAWVALGNALVEHADGSLTPAAIYAYRRAAQVAPGSPAPGYFLGLALIRQGRILEARQVWAATLAESRADSPPRALLEERLARLDDLLASAGAQPAGPPAAPPTP